MNFALEVREQGRGMMGALLVLGISFAYTTETWWLAVEVPATHLLAFVVVGIALIVPITRAVGFRGMTTDRRCTSRSPRWCSRVSRRVRGAGAARRARPHRSAPGSRSDDTGSSGPLAFGASLANELLSGDQRRSPRRRSRRVWECSRSARCSSRRQSPQPTRWPYWPPGQLAEDRRDSAHLAGRDVSDPL